MVTPGNASALPLGARDGAFLLGAVAVGCCIRLLVLAGEGGGVTGEHVVWLAVCVVAAAYSAACAVVLAVRAAAGPP